MYSIILLARIILSWLLSANVRPPEALRPIIEIIYTLTDPPLRLARPLIPPIQFGRMAFDLSILLVFFVLWLLRSTFCG